MCKHALAAHSQRSAQQQTCVHSGSRLERGVTHKGGCAWHPGKLFEVIFRTKLFGRHSSQAEPQAPTLSASGDCRSAHTLADAGYPVSPCRAYTGQFSNAVFHVLVLWFAENASWAGSHRKTEGRAGRAAASPMNHPGIWMMCQPKARERRLTLGFIDRRCDT